jgi:hypothetical protein
MFNKPVPYVVFSTSKSDLRSRANCSPNLSVMFVNLVAPKLELSISICSINCPQKSDLSTRTKSDQSRFSFFFNLVTLEAGAKGELLFNKLASEVRLK